MSKLHLRLVPGSQLPRCGRMLNIHRDKNAQLQDRVMFAEGEEHFTQLLRRGHSCSHCAREIGLLPRLTRFASKETEL